MRFFRRVPRIKPIDLVLVFLAIPIGTLGAYSTGKWISAGEQGPSEIRRAKEELLDTHCLRKHHHCIYEKVGAQAWNNQVKPDFMRAITYATIKDTGNLLPDWPDVVKWAKSHPEKANLLMQEAGDFSDTDRKCHQ